MKDIFSMLLCLLYLLSSVGVSAKAHYCGDYLAGFSLNNPNQEIGCGCSVSNDSESCCKEISVDYKVETDHSMSNNNLLKNVIAPTICRNQHTSMIGLSAFNLVAFSKGFSFKDPPPRLLFCVFLC